MSTAIYIRVSSKGQEFRSQEAELQTWANNQSEPLIWFKDKATGTNMNRPGFEKLLEALRRGQIKRVVVWRLDRLGRTAKGLLTFFEDLQAVGCNFLSLRDAIDLSTPSGRLLVTVLSGVAEFETEVRSERQRAGIDAVRASNGGRCTWGGRKKGTRIAVTAAKEAAIKELHASKKPIAEIARAVELSRPTIYKVLAT